jgi:hypothetical protein
MPEDGKQWETNLANLATEALNQLSKVKLLVPFLGVTGSELWIT